MRAAGAGLVKTESEIEAEAKRHVEEMLAIRAGVPPQLIAERRAMNAAIDSMERYRDAMREGAKITEAHLHAR